MSNEHWRVIVNSIGHSGASLIHILKSISPLAESRIASLLYRAPSELLTNIPQQTAEEIAQILQTAGLDCLAVDDSYQFTPGDDGYEVALVIHDYSNITAIIEQIVGLLGVDIATARKILCATPTVLLARISANTVTALCKRFQPLGVDLDVSRPAEALFDVFLGDCPSTTRQNVIRLLHEQSINVLTQPSNGHHQPLLATELSKAQVDPLWERIQRSSYPVRIVNRDFQRFDLRLDEAQATPEMIGYLVESTGMPEKLAPKVIAKAPVVLQQNIRFSELVKALETIDGLGGRASGHLLVFQMFSLAIEQVGDVKASAHLLSFLTDQPEAQIIKILKSTRRIEEPLTNPQARWLQAELKKVGTEASLTLL